MWNLFGAVSFICLHQPKIWKLNTKILLILCNGFQRELIDDDAREMYVND